MGGFSRMERVDELLKRELAKDMVSILSREGFESVLVSVTKVKTSNDLRNASVWVSVFGSDELRNKVMGRIVHHRRDLQRMVGTHVRLKYTPLLSFKLDTSLEKGDRVLDLLSKMDEATDAAGDVPEQDKEEDFE